MPPKRRPRFDVGGRTLPHYKYTASDFSLKKTQGEITAQNEREARKTLRNSDLFVITIRASEKKRESGTFSALRERRIALNEVTLFSRQFATLIDSGVAISRALFLLARNAKNPSFAKVLRGVTSDIEAGVSLSAALEKHNSVFPSIYTDMVAAGEMSGALPEVLNRLATYLENDKSIRAKVKSAFIYPAVVSVVAVAVVFLMLLLVIPRFIPLFDGMGVALPLPTRVLISLSQLLQEYWWAIPISLVALVLFVKFYGKTTSGKRLFDRIKLNLPIVGDIVTKAAVARFCRTLETLQRSGVPLVQSLTIVGKASGNVVIQEAVEAAITNLERGEGISAPLEKTKVFPFLVTQMLSIGEETGDLERILSKIADFYEEEVNTAVRGMTALIEPVITVVIGVLVGFIALAIIAPMYELMGNMQRGM